MTDRSESKPKPVNTFIVRFYSEEGAEDTEGRTLEDILNFGDDALEYHHDYIQVLFPLPERSRVSPDAPIIRKETRDVFLEHEDLRKRVFTAFKRMGDFYAFDVSGDETSAVLAPKSDFKKLASKTWLTRMDHNHLRITRIIRCLRILGLEPVALAFHQALQDNAVGVSEKSLMFWERAAKRPLHLPPDEPNDKAKGMEWLRDE